MADGRKRGLWYLLYIIYVFLILYGSLAYWDRLAHQAATEYIGLPLMWFITFFPLGFGVMLGLPRLVYRGFKPGRWRVDWLKIAIVAGPAMIYAFIMPIHFVVVPMLEESISRLIRLKGYNYTAFIMGVVAAYTILESFDKTAERLNTGGE